MRGVEQRGKFVCVCASFQHLALTVKILSLELKFAAFLWPQIWFKKLVRLLSNGIPPPLFPVDVAVIAGERDVLALASLRVVLSPKPSSKLKSWIFLLPHFKTGIKNSSKWRIRKLISAKFNFTLWVGIAFICFQLSWRTTAAAAMPYTGFSRGLLDCTDLRSNLADLFQTFLVLLQVARCFPMVEGVSLSFY